MYSIQTGIDDGDQLHFHANYINPSTLGTAVAGVNSYTNGGGVLTIDVDASHMDSGSHKFAVGDIALLYNFNPPNSVTGTSFYVANVSDNSDGSQTLTIGFSPGDSLQASDQAILAGENAYLLTVAEYHGGSSIGAGGSKSLANLDVTDPAKASTALDTIDGAIRYLTSGAISMGSLESRLEFSKSNFLVVNEATQAARSNIQDADFAAESARLAKSMVLRDSAAAMVSQSRVQSELVLMLLKNVM